MSSDETQVVYISKIGQMGSYACLTLSLVLGMKQRQELVIVTIILSLVIQQYPLSFLGFSRTLRFKHSTYHSHFLRFIASTSGLEALHLSTGITLQHALALLFSFLSLCLSLSLLPFRHLFAPLRLCLPVSPPPSYLLIICFILSAS